MTNYIVIHANDRDLNIFAPLEDVSDTLLTRFENEIIRTTSQGDTRTTSQGDTRTWQPYTSVYPKIIYANSRDMTIFAPVVERS